LYDVNIRNRRVATCSAIPQLICWLVFVLAHSPAIARHRRPGLRRCLLSDSCQDEASMELSEVGAAVSHFGTRLFTTLCEAEPTTNVVLSPLAVFASLAMATAGATPKTSTHQELLHTLGISSHADIGPLIRELLASPNSPIRMANAVSTKQTIQPDFVQLVKKIHNASATTLGNSYEPLNTWVGKQTDGRITDLLADPVDPLTVAVLLSAVFFKGRWNSAFNLKESSKGVFHQIDGSQQSMIMMQQTSSMAASHRVSALADAAAVKLDYAEANSVEGAQVHSKDKDSHSHKAMQGIEDRGKEFCALLILPSHGGAKSLAQTIHALAEPGALRAALVELKEQKVRLEVPRVRASFGSKSLKGSLRSLGVSSAFDADGGFLAMSADPSVHVSDVLTKAVIEMDEEGTVAAAAAAVVMMRRSRPAPPLHLAFDRPFLVVVLHVPTGTPLFVVQVHQPGVSE